jgi:pyrroloquinoline quinone biosynthesis protein B
MSPGSPLGLILIAEGRDVRPGATAMGRGFVIRIRILGTAAGGGLPQWNCRCRYCEAARRGLIPPRLQASLAFSAGDTWFVVNATPDLGQQLARTRALHPRSGVRHTPMAGVLLTDAELDHTLGLLQLREGGSWSLLAPHGILATLSAGFDVASILTRYQGVTVRGIDPESSIALGEGDDAVRVTWLTTGGDAPLYAGAGPGTVCALVLTSLRSGRSVVYAPGVATLTPSLDAACRAASTVYFDGTFWTGDEMESVSGSRRNAADMGHWPIGGGGGSAEYLASLDATVRYVHLNNTNPILDPTSPQRRELQRLGLDVAEDGDALEFP